MCKRGLWNTQLMSLLICNYYMHQKARGLKPLDPLTNPSHFIKYMMIKSCVCFQRSCEARRGGPHSEAPARCTQGSAKHLVPFQLRVRGFCLALVVPGGSKQPAKNSHRTKRQEETAERRLTAETFPQAVIDNAELSRAKAFITRSE